MNSSYSLGYKIWDVFFLRDFLVIFIGNVWYFETFIEAT